MKVEVINVILAMVCAPLLLGVINRIKALFSGRRGQPLFQLYYDLHKLVRRGVVYSFITTPLFWIGPLIGLAAGFTAVLIAPQAAGTAVISFQGDIILFVYLFGLARFFTIIAAMDTGSSFEGMGASREALFSIFVEPAIFLGFITLAYHTSCMSLSGIYSNFSWTGSPVLILVAVAFFILFLVENSRVPVDDPNTHLELTMVHEVMVLDHSGFDFAAIQYWAALKLWVLGSLVIGILLPAHSGNILINELIFITGMFLLAISVGIIESVTARLRLVKVPQFIIIAFALTAIALILQIR